MASASAGAGGAAVGSPGFMSGNLVQMPFHMPFNFCGNTGNFIALLNPAFGNHCINAEKHEHEKHHRHHHGGEED
ncbi:chaplin [Streptomyces albospinus]|uniref:chaplin n=1 Tax=Streptomyces albospinus TaxID=285515 RepID=UPI0027E3BBFD|nr:chaplin [Streptomyces albospinus]